MATAPEPTSERWEFRASTNDYRCKAHGVEFERGEVCEDCSVDTGPAPGNEADQESEHDCVFKQRECDDQSAAKWLRKRARELDASGEFNAAAKYFAEANKARVSADLIREKRAAREHDRMLVRHRAQMAGLRASH